MEPNDLYHIDEGEDFTHNWERFNSVVKSEMHFNFINPIEEILVDTGLNDSDKIQKMRKVRDEFVKIRKAYTAWQDAIVQFHSQ